MLGLCCDGKAGKGIWLLASLWHTDRLFQVTNVTRQAHLRQHIPWVDTDLRISFGWQSLPHYPMSGHCWLRLGSAPQSQAGMPDKSELKLWINLSCLSVGPSGKEDGFV